MEQSNKDVATAFPFEKKFVAVCGSSMAYIDVGNPSPTVAVFLHGNPTSSYLWRNIVPYVSSHMRCIAPDLVGFGDSDKVPGLDYRIADHLRYLDAFLDSALPTQKLILVVHDWGSALGLDWARRHEVRIAGLALMEFITPMHWSETPERFRNSFSKFREPGLGRSLLIDQNLFVEQILPRGVKRPLQEEEMSWYRKPFLDPSSREPVYRFPNEIPLDGHPADVWEMSEKYMEWLKVTDLPKLWFWVTPGVFITGNNVGELREQLHNATAVYLGEGIHYVQEDYPHEIGRHISAWIKSSVSKWS